MKKSTIIHKCQKNARIWMRNREKREKPAIKEATEFQDWFNRLGGMIENKDYEKVLEKFQ